MRSGLPRERKWNPALNNIRTVLTDGNTPFAFVSDSNQFAEAAAAQKHLWQTVLDLQHDINESADKAGREAMRYEIGSIFYENKYTFYNHLWEGNRTKYLFFGKTLSRIMQDRNSRKRYRSYLEFHNNYLQAYAVFSGIVAETSDKELRKEAKFSMGMCLYRANYGYEMNLYWSLPVWHERIADIFSQFALEYPESPLADDALYMSGIYSRDMSALKKVVTDYPEGDMKEKAASFLQSSGIRITPEKPGKKRK